MPIFPSHLLRALVGLVACVASFSQAAAAQDPRALISVWVPEGCTLLGAVEARIAANDEHPRAEDLIALEEAFARQVAAVGGQLGLRHGVGYTWDSLAQYGYAFRCEAASLAPDAERSCRGGPLELPPTAQEQRWDTGKRGVFRERDCSVRWVYAIGERSPLLGASWRGAYPSEDCATDLLAWHRQEPAVVDRACSERIAALRRSRGASPPQAGGPMAPPRPDERPPESRGADLLRMQSRELLATLPRPGATLGRFSRCSPPKSARQPRPR
jgi:hypothetical protein